MISTLRRILQKVSQDDILTQAAALALYTTLSLAPLVILLLSFLSTLGLSLQRELVAQVNDLIGGEAAAVLGTIIEGVGDQKKLSSIAGIAGIATLAVAASAIFAQLQSSLNLIFRSPPKNSSDEKWWQELWVLIKKRLVSMGMVLTFVFISIVSLVISSALTFLIQQGEGLWPEIINTILSLAIFSLLFYSIFRWMPDRKIPNRASLLGGILTAVFFVLGKALIGMYLGQAAVGSAYGAAGSLVVLLAWTYYSSLIVFLGAETSVVIFMPEVQDHGASV